MSKKVSYWSNCQFRPMSRSNTEATNQSNPAATLMQAQSLRFTAVFNVFVAGRQKKTDKHRITLEGEKGRYLTNAKDYPERRAFK